MNQQETLYAWFVSVASSFSGMRKSQAKVLAAFAFGIAVASDCALSHVAVALSSVGKPDTVERRLQRFLANVRVVWRRCCVELSAWVFRVLPNDARIVLLVDETSLHDRLRAMVVCLAYRHRALPLAWWCYTNEKWPMRQVELIDTLLGWVAEGMKKARVQQSHAVLVQADRGIGTSPDLIDRVERRGWHYLFRVQGQTRLRLADGTEMPFSSLVTKPRTKARVPAEAFKNAGWRRCRAIGLWRRKQKQPWLLVTNDPSIRGKEYAWRMWEEEAFRDFKSYGWRWEGSRVWQPAHANRLWLAMALAYLWVVSLGTHVLNSKQTLREFTRGNRQRFSVFQLGLRALKRWLDTRYLLPCHMLLIPLHARD